MIKHNLWWIFFIYNTKSDNVLKKYAYGLTKSKILNDYFLPKIQLHVGEP